MAAGATGLSPFETEFARAWDTPGHTRYQLPDTDVNLVLAARYSTGKPLTFTRAMLWEMEVRKAHPGTYIPFVVRTGSDGSWNRRDGDGGEYLDRCSMQRLWLNPQHYELILERAFLNHDQQRSPSWACPSSPAPMAHCCARAPASRCSMSSTRSAAPNSSH
jgi:hypothetical protein